MPPLRKRNRKFNPKPVFLILFLAIMFAGPACLNKADKTLTHKDIVTSPISDTLRIGNDRTSDGVSGEKSKSHRKTFHDYITEDEDFLWVANHPDTTKYSCEIKLNEVTVTYWFHGQCVYNYFSYLRSDTTMDVVWTYRSDCFLDMEFLDKSNGVKKHPKKGDDFAAYTLVNDTTIKVAYKYPEWTKKVNEIAKDSLFPVYYYLYEDR